MLSRRQLPESIEELKHQQYVIEEFLNKQTKHSAAEGLLQLTEDVKESAKQQGVQDEEFLGNAAPVQPPFEQTEAVVVTTNVSIMLQYYHSYWYRRRIVINVQCDRVCQTVWCDSLFRESQGRFNLAFSSTHL